jgi:hypothetical protein
MERASCWFFAGLVAVGLTMSWAASPAKAVPPDPDNAALLYYQAFLTVADFDKEARTHISDVAVGRLAPDEKTREYIGKCQGAIDYAEAARDLQVCHWGFRYSKGIDALMPQLAQMRFLTFVLLAEARLNASDGDYRSALDRCLMMGSVSRHVGDETLISYLVSVSVRRLTYECMEDIIGQAAGDAELLAWLQDELATSGGEKPFPVTALKIEREVFMALMTMENLEKIAGILDDEKMKARLLATASEETLARARDLYSQWIMSSLAVLSSAMPYEQAHQQLTALHKSLDRNDPATMAADSVMPGLVKILTIKTVQQAHANAVRAAVDICLHRAGTGSLPVTLPAGVPKDPFSGRDFQYERTDAGFVLRCQGLDLDKGTIHEFEFRVK